MKPVHSEIEIAAAPERVFAILLDFDAYPEWNRFTPRISLRSADLSVGAELDLDCQMTPTELLKDEHEVILEVDRERLRFAMGTSRKRGRPGIRSQRLQICERLGPERTRLINVERFEGLLAPLVYFRYRRKLETAFRRYCEAVKARAE